MKINIIHHLQIILKKCNNKKYISIETKNNVDTKKMYLQINERLFDLCYYYFFFFKYFYFKLISVQYNNGLNY